MKKWKLLVVLFAGTVFAAAYAPSALSADFPNKPIEMIVTYSAGGGTDISMRVFGTFLEKELGVAVPVLNKPGASGVTGWMAIAKAKPDGYTVGNINLPAVLGTFVTGDLPVDPRTAYKFLGNFVFDPNCVAVSSKSKFQNVGDLVAHLKQNPEGLSYAATGRVSTDGLTALSIEKTAGVKFRIVNFKGGKEAITAVLGGHVDVVGLTVSEAIEYAKDGSLRLLGVGGSERNADFPNVPTFAEQGFKLRINGSSRGLQVPAGVSDAVLSNLREAVKKAAMNEGYRAKAKEMGFQGTYIGYQEVEKEIHELIDWLQKELPK